MGRGRSFVVLFVIALGLGAYIYFVEAKRTPGETAKKPKAFSVEADKIQEVTIKSESGETSTLRKTDGSWKLTAPIAETADQSEASGITSSLSTLEVGDVVEENPSNLKDFGLAPPRVTVDFKVEGDANPKRIEVGAKTSTGSDLYARLANEKRVFLVPSYLDTTFNRTTFDLRDKAILKVDREKVDAIEIVATASADGLKGSEGSKSSKDSKGSKGPEASKSAADEKAKAESAKAWSGTTRLVKQDNDWKLTVPWQARADFGAVEGLITKVSSGQMKSMVAPEAGDLKQYGLDKPAVTVRIGTGSAQASLAIGKDAGEGKFYARDLSRPAIFTVESSLADDLKKGPSEYRKKDVFEFRPFNATRLEIVRGSETLAFEKVKPPKDAKDQTEKWRQTSPSARDVDSAKMDTLLSGFSNLRAQSFSETTAKTGLDKPELTLTVHYDEGKKQETVSFGKSGADAYAARTGEPGPAKLDATEYGNAVKTIDEIKKVEEPKKDNK